METYGRLLLKFTSPELSSEDINEVRELIAAGIDWRSFLDSAVRNKVTPLVGYHVARHGLGRGDEATVVPNAWAYSSSFVGNRERNRRLADEFRVICRAFDAAGVVFAPRKGFVLGDLYYGNISVRRSNDFDFLISRDSTPDAAGALHDLDYVQGRLSDDGVNIEPAARGTRLFWQVNLRNLFPWAKPGLAPEVPAFEVDLCHRIFATERLLSTERILAQATPAMVCDTQVLVPTRAHLLLDLCCHLHKEATDDVFKALGNSLQLSKFLDVRLVADAMAEDDWDAFEEAVEESESEEEVSFALDLTRVIFEGRGDELGWASLAVRDGRFGSSSLGKPADDFWAALFAPSVQPTSHGLPWQ